MNKINMQEFNINYTKAFFNLLKIIFIFIIFLFINTKYSFASTERKFSINKIESINNEYPKVNVKFSFKDSFNRVLPELNINNLHLEEELKEIDSSNIYLQKITPKKEKISLAFVIDNSKNIISKSLIINNWIEKINSYLYKKDTKVFFTLDSLEPILNFDFNKIIFDIDDLNKNKAMNSLLASINYLAKSHESKRIIFLFSDGFDQSSKDIKEIINKANGFNINIYTINFISPSGTLKRLAQTTDALVIPEDKNTKETLDKLFKKISIDLSEEYMLTFYSPFDSSKYERNLKITLEYEDKKFKSEQKYFVESKKSIQKIFLLYSVILIIILFLIIYIIKKLNLIKKN